MKKKVVGYIVILSIETVCDSTSILMPDQNRNYVQLIPGVTIVNSMTLVNFVVTGVISDVSQPLQITFLKFYL